MGETGTSKIKFSGQTFKADYLENTAGRETIDQGTDNFLYIIAKAKAPVKLTPAITATIKDGQAILTGVTIPPGKTLAETDLRLQELINSCAREGGGKWNIYTSLSTDADPEFEYVACWTETGVNPKTKRKENLFIVIQQADPLPEPQPEKPQPPAPPVEPPLPAPTPEPEPEPNPAQPQPSAFAKAVSELSTDIRPTTCLFVTAEGDRVATIGELLLTALEEQQKKPIEYGSYNLQTSAAVLDVLNPEYKGKFDTNILNQIIVLQTRINDPLTPVESLPAISASLQALIRQTPKVDGINRRIAFGMR